VEVIAVDADADLTDATLIAGVLEDLEPAPGSESAFASIDSAHLDSAGFEGKKGQTLKVPHDGAAALLLVGLGDEISFETVRAASGNAIRKAKTERVVTLLAHVGIDGATRAVVEGSALGGYQFRTYKTDDDDELDAKTVEVVGADEAELTAAAIAARSRSRPRNAATRSAAPAGSAMTARSSRGLLSVQQCNGPGRASSGAFDAEDRPLDHEDSTPWKPSSTRTTALPRCCRSPKCQTRYPRTGKS